MFPECRGVRVWSQHSLHWRTVGCLLPLWTGSKYLVVCVCCIWECKKVSFCVGQKVAQQFCLKLFSLCFHYLYTILCMPSCFLLSFFFFSALSSSIDALLSIKASRQILFLGLRSWWTLNPSIHLSFSVLFPTSFLSIQSTSTFMPSQAALRL